MITASTSDSLSCLPPASYTLCTTYIPHSLALEYRSYHSRESAEPGSEPGSRFFKMPKLRCQTHTARSCSSCNTQQGAIPRTKARRSLLQRLTELTIQVASPDARHHGCRRMPTITGANARHNGCRRLPAMAITGANARHNGCGGVADSAAAAAAVSVRLGESARRACTINTARLPWPKQCRAAAAAPTPPAPAVAPGRPHCTAQPGYRSAHKSPQCARRKAGRLRARAGPQTLRPRRRRRRRAAAATPTR